MKQIVIPLCSLLLAFTLAGCAGGAKHESPAASSTVSAQNSRTVSTGSAKSSEPVPVSPVESKESLPQESSESGQPEKFSAEHDAGVRQIRVTAADGQAVTFTLNDSAAADALYRQLPLSVTVDDFGGSEKIFYPPEKLDTGNAPLAQGPAGTLAYYEPWGNVAMFYGQCGGASGLYALGDAISGADILPELSGEIRVEAVGVPSASPEALGAESISSQQPPPSSTESPLPQETSDETSSEENTAMKLNVQIGNSAFTATLADNSTVDALKELLEDGPLTLAMSDYAGVEKGADLGVELPQNNVQMNTQAGDLILYQGRTFVIYYDTNSWSLTPIGKIDNVDEGALREALGTGDVSVILSIQSMRWTN